MKKYQLVRDVPDRRRWLVEMFDSSTFLAEFAARGFTPTGKVGADHLHAHLRGEPEFTGLHGPMGNEKVDGVPVVRYETRVVSNALSE